ncbi:hypothetical protein EI94DRAFT_1740002 [Lactarius quietus]|nr:hypothetical protein EI94DRAFT_1740002 [Lactarius quietus]
MFRETYDLDITVFSPQGRLRRQVEYAFETFKQAISALRGGLTRRRHLSAPLALRTANWLRVSKRCSTLTTTSHHDRKL